MPALWEERRQSGLSSGWQSVHVLAYCIGEARLRIESTADINSSSHVQISQLMACEKAMMQLGERHIIVSMLLFLLLAVHGSVAQLNIFVTAIEYYRLTG